MAKDYGSGVSRTLNPTDTQYQTVIFQQGKPPLDADFGLIQDIAQQTTQTAATRAAPSGWLGSGVNDHESYITNDRWSNWIRFGQQRTGETKAVQWAIVNGWHVPVTGTQTGTPPGSPDDDATWNRITLDPPPSNSGDSRIDFVFLEVWLAKLPANPGTDNKPSASAIYRHGNVEGGMSYITDDMVDPALNFEVTQRVQLQYRIRVVTGLVGLQSYPDGFDPANVKGQGAATAATAFTFENMREELGDPGLWRSGDGTQNDLGSVDGYSYAIPLCTVFRRNSVAWDGDPGTNLNGSFNRNPTAVDRTGWTTFGAAPTITADMNASQLTLELSTATDIDLPTSPATAVTIKIGDEVMTYSSITGTTMTLTARGAAGTRAETHVTGEAVVVDSGRPDRLFSDQIATTDILDMRHVVNPAGFSARSILKNGVDQLLRGTLRANWKRSGGGPQGSYVTYQDKISSSAGSLGVTQLDAPDNIRQIFSDASVIQPVVFIANPPAATGVTEDISTTWSLGLAGTCDNSAGVASQFSASTTITIPIAQFKITVPGADQDQVQFPAQASTPAVPVVSIRVGDAEADLVPGTDFSTSVPTGPDDDLTITLLGPFAAAADTPLFITLHVQYGAGRGMSRRPDTVQGLSYLNASAGTLLRQFNIPSNNIPLSVAWAPLWAKFRSTPLDGAVPVTAESYVDPGSKTVVLSPFRRIDLPPNIGAKGALRAIRNATLHSSNGPMPDTGKFGGTNDPLDLFSSGAQGTDADSTYTILPRHLIPGWGAIHVPIVHTDTADFEEGINFGFRATKNLSAGGQLSNFVPNFGQRITTFSTINLNTDAAITYNSAVTFGGLPTAGMRKFTDTRGLNREGLELPPFYGIARLFAVYEAQDYKSLGSAYDTSRDFQGGSPSNATNLLKQDFEGPPFWIEIDSDGDSTFILNADAIDITRSPNAIANFAAGEYIIESDIFGFDRGAFDLTDDCRIVLTRERSDATDLVASPTDDGIQVDSLALAIPAPAQGADSIAVNFSRTPYQGDPWGSQNSQLDIAYLQGPLTSSDAHQIGSTELDNTALTRPNEKVVEVVDSIGFVTTLGSGRISGDHDTTADLNFRNPGFEDGSNYPPVNAVDDRPTYGLGALSASDDLLPLGTEYHGCIERLPLGSMFRDKDFRGDAIDKDSDANQSSLGLVFMDPGPSRSSTVADSSRLEQFTVPVYTKSQAIGAANEVLVHVDGETTNLSLLTNYRTTRGGSVFVGSTDRPGGEVSGSFSRLASTTNYNSSLCCQAFLVRNAVTSIGANEVSAGSELMLLITTTVARRHDTNDIPAFTLCSTQGSGEGFSAADLYRLPGRPLVNSDVKLKLDPSTVPLTGLISYKPRIGG